VPAKLRKVKKGYKVYTPNTGAHSKAPMTLRNAKAQLRLLNAIEYNPNFKPNKKKKGK